MRYYTFDELTERYGLSKGGFSKFFHASENQLVKDGVKTYHQNGKKIIFTEAAVEILDELRGLNKDIIQAQKETADQIRVRELLEEKNTLLEEISTLKTKILLLQEESKADKERIIKLTEENGQVKLLKEWDKTKSEQLDQAQQEKEEFHNLYNETSVKLAETRADLSAKEREVSAAQLRNDELASQNQVMQQELQAQKNETAKLQEALAAEKNKSWWQKIFG